MGVREQRAGMSELLGPFPNWSRIPFLLYLSARAPQSSQTTRQRERAESLLSTPAELSPAPSSFPSLPQMELSGLEGNSKELERTSSGRETSLFFFSSKRVIVARVSVRATVFRRNTQEPRRLSSPNAVFLQ